MRIRFFTLVGLVVLMGLAVGCEPRVDESYKPVLASFYEDVKLVDDPLYKGAALKEEQEPQRAKDYFDAHERLRNIFEDPKSKAAILATFLSLEPTSLRPIKATPTADGAEIVVALGPTDDKTGTFNLKKVDAGWKIADFNGTWAKRQAEINASIKEPGEAPEIANTPASAGAAPSSDPAAH